jgi:outer membrane lipopolysaccharide assembly protein LptE/RlpB
MKRIPWLILGCALAVQCGYHLRGTGSFLPTHIKKISIPMFKNETTRFELDVKLTQSVINELEARARLEVSADAAGADAVLSGDIVSFNVNPIAFSGQATADRYNIVIVAKIVLRDLVNQKTLFSNPSFNYIEEYEVPQGTDFESVETQAIDKVAEKFARSLVVNILEGF